MDYTMLNFTLLKKSIKLLLLGVLGFFVVEAAFYTYFIKANDLEYNLTTVYNVLPVLIIYDSIETFSRHKDVPEALNFGFVVVVNKNSDKDFLIHELTHAKQYYRYCLMAPVLYTFVQRFRVMFEYEAYMSESVKLSDEEFISYMHTFYNVTLSKQDIYKIIL